MNKSHGILMSGEMVRAWLAGLKSQTRRTRGLKVVNINPNGWELKDFSRNGEAVFYNIDGVNPIMQIAIKPPYGKVGDELYFKETWKMWEEPELGKDFLHFRADDAKVDPTWWTEEDFTKPNPIWLGKFNHWQSSMLMPKMCARIRVPITGVRVERLQDITLKDVAAEGWPNAPKTQEIWVAELPNAWSTGFLWYRNLWDSLNAKRGFGWERNPWVWVYEFEKNQPPSAKAAFPQMEELHLGEEEKA